MSDIDIDSMDPASAREYVLSFISTLRGIQKERAGLERELDLWEKRAKLAEEKNEQMSSFLFKKYVCFMRFLFFKAILTLLREK